MSAALRPARYREPVKPFSTALRDVKPLSTALRDAPQRGSRQLPQRGSRQLFSRGASSVAHSPLSAARRSNRSTYAAGQSGSGGYRTSSGYRVTGGYPGADHRRVEPRSAPGRWLYPFSSVGGPNNQYLQLILAALAAKASGRTLLLAPFVKWGHDPGTFAKNFSSTFDAGALARFVPVRSLAAPRAFSFSAVSQVVTAGGAPSTDNFRTLCYAAGLPCDGDALRASATGFGSEALARCKGTVKSDGSYMRCLLSKWADRSALGFSAWGFGKVKVRAPLH